MGSAGTTGSKRSCHISHEMWLESYWDCARDIYTSVNISATDCTFSASRGVTAMCKIKIWNIFSGNVDTKAQSEDADS
jgi:hypothetical protein